MVDSVDAKNLNDDWMQREEEELRALLSNFFQTVLNDLSERLTEAYLKPTASRNFPLSMNGMLHKAEQYVRQGYSEACQEFVKTHLNAQDGFLANGFSSCEGDRQYLLIALHVLADTKGDPDLKEGIASAIYEMLLSATKWYAVNNLDDTLHYSLKQPHD